MMSGSGEEQSEDSLLAVIGLNGKWQFITFIVISSIGIPAAWNMLAIQFLAPKNLDHWCAPPNQLQHLSVEEWKKLAIPEIVKDGKLVYEKCRMYNLNFTLMKTDPPAPPTDYKENTAKINCRTWTREDGTEQTYDYDLSRFSDTLVNTFDLVCDNSEMVAHAQSSYMVGILLGAVIGGICADWFGRRPTLLVFTIFLVIFGVAASFAQTILVFMYLRFLVALSMMALFTTGFVYILEPVGGKWRAVYGISYEFPFAIGFMSLAAIAYFLNNWRQLELFIILPCTAFISFYFLFPESPRWLLTRNNEDAARTIVKKICTRNNREYKDTYPLPDQSSPTSDQETSRATLLDLFRTPNLRWRTLNFYYNWFVNSFVYYGLSLNSDGLGGDIFINIFIGGAVEIPAYAISIYLLMRSGRRWPLCLTMVIGGTACLGTMIFEKNVFTLDWPIIMFAMIGKLCISASFAIVYVFSAEVFPTVLRTTGVGSSSMCARIGSISAPYISLYGGKAYRYLPVILFGVTSIIAGLLALLLPETKGKSLPDTIEEGEAFGTSEDEGGQIPFNLNRKHKNANTASYSDGDESSQL